MTNWRVTETAAITFHGQLGYGFNVVNEHGRPVMTIVYDEPKEPLLKSGPRLGRLGSFSPTV